MFAGQMNHYIKVGAFRLYLSLTYLLRYVLFGVPLKKPQFVFRECRWATGKYLEMCRGKLAGDEIALFYVSLFPPGRHVKRTYYKQMSNCFTSERLNLSASESLPLAEK